MEVEFSVRGSSFGVAKVRIGKSFAKVTESAQRLQVQVLELVSCSKSSVVTLLVLKLQVVS